MSCWSTACRTSWRAASCWPAFSYTWTTDTVMRWGGRAFYFVITRVLSFSAMPSRLQSKNIIFYRILSYQYHILSYFIISYFKYVGIKITFGLCCTTYVILPSLRVICYCTVSVCFLYRCDISKRILNIRILKLRKIKMLPELKLKNIDSKNIGIGIALWKRFIFSEGDTVLLSVFRIRIRVFSLLRIRVFKVRIRPLKN